MRCSNEAIVNVGSVSDSEFLRSDCGSGELEESVVISDCLAPAAISRPRVLEKK